MKLTIIFLLSVFLLLTVVSAESDLNSWIKEFRKTCNEELTGLVAFYLNKETMRNHARADTGNRTDDQIAAIYYKSETSD